MSDLKIYGVIGSRAFRCLWAADELGLPYEHVPVGFDGKQKSPEYLSVNPNGRVPAMKDGNLDLFESLAINLYLAQKHGKGLWPASLEDVGRTYQWSFWVMTEVEKPLLDILLENAMKPEGQRDQKKLERAHEALKAPFGVLDQALAKSDYLLGSAFSIADLNVASVMSWARAARIDLSAYPNLDRWLTQCLGRPAVRALSAKRKAGG